MEEKMFDELDGLCTIGNGKGSMEHVKECIQVLYERYSMLGTDVLCEHLLGFIEYIVASTKYAEYIENATDIDEAKNEWTDPRAFMTNSIVYTNIYNYAEDRIHEESLMAKMAGRYPWGYSKDAEED